MIRGATSAEHPACGPKKAGAKAADPVRCPLQTGLHSRVTETAELCDVLAEAGCPLAPGLQDRLRFETLLAELSATFINLPAGQVDAQIESSLRQLVTVLGVDRGAVLEVLADQGQLVVTHSYQLAAVPPLPRVILSAQLPWYVKTMQAGEVFRISRVPDDYPPEASLDREYCTRIGLKSQVMIPFNVRGRVAGAIGFSSFRTYCHWPEDLVRRLRLVGEVFANALARRRADETLQAREHSLRQARENLRKLAAKLLHAQEEERRRIAREMHDDWTQRLALLGIDVANLEKHLATPATALSLLRAMQTRLIGLSEDVHALSRQLHPSIMDDLGLVEALRSECASFSRREKVFVHYRPERVPANLSKDVALCLYRVAQEALRNLAKHADVTEAWLSLDATETELLLNVRDEGLGFDAGARHTQPGLGLSGMEERVRLIQGTLSVTSAPGRGTTVEVRAPLQRGAP
jgi:signal transduction histidine kinase